MANPDFKAAARRHHDDAGFLLGGGRWPNADHLAGVAAECALKAIIQFAPFGATPNPKGFLVWGGPPGKEMRDHVNKLWGELAQNISGHSAPVFATLFAGPSPFADWDVSERYASGTTIGKQKAAARVSAAGQIMTVLQQAELDGYVS